MNTIKRAILSRPIQTGGSAITERSLDALFIYLKLVAKIWPVKVCLLYTSDAAAIYSV